MKNYLVLTLIILLFPFCDSYAADKKPVRTYPDKLQLRYAKRLTALDLEIWYQHKKDSDKSQSINYTTNQPEVHNISIIYKDFGFSTSFSTNKHQHDTKKCGTTDFFDFQLYHYTQSFSFEILFQKYKGYYLENAHRFDLTRGSPETIFPDLEVNNITLNVMYSFNDAFSFASVMQQHERLLVDNYAFLIIGSVSRCSIDSNTPLIPESEKKYYPKNAGFRGGTFTGFSIAPGFSLTTVSSSSFFFSFSLFIGPGLMHKEINSDDNINNRIGTITHLNAKLALGFNADLFFFGLICSLDTYDTIGFDEENINVSTTAGYGEIFGGVRF